MSFAHAWVFLLLPPLLAALWWVNRRGYAPTSPRAQRIGIAIRGMIVFLLLAVVAEPQLHNSTQRRHVFLLIDVSGSVSAENLKAAVKDVGTVVEAARGDRADSLFTVILFGRRPQIAVSASDDPREVLKSWEGRILHRERIGKLQAERVKLLSATGTEAKERASKLDEQLKQLKKFRDEVAGERTDVESAVRLALNGNFADAIPALYVFTDAQFNRGNWQQAWSEASDRKVPVHLVALDRKSKPETAVTDVIVPESARINEAFTARIRVAANTKTTGNLVLFKDGFRVGARPVTLKPGNNEIEFSGLFFRKKGFHRVEARLQSVSDTQLANNVCRTLVNVPGPLRVLYIDGNETQTPYLKNALETEGLKVEVRPAGGVPQRISELIGFDAFILCNVPADKLSLPQMRMIRTYVEEFGGGFAMLGGEESFGLGGYYKTPIEEILPVRMPIRKDLVRPSLALFLVIDKSGSMSGAKIQLAKRAGIATAEVVDRRDRIGVIGFDGSSRIILELTPAGNRDTITSRIGSLDAGGGTNLYPALKDARQRLQASTARRKHVIVLSDGQTQGQGYEQLARAMATEGVTISTVGIGEGADLKLLRSIAQAAGGRTYYTNDFNRIPQIFTREALRASKGMLVEKLTQPKLAEPDVSLKGIDTDELPLLLGYVATTPKSKARTILVSETGDPILARWRFGLGRTAAFTSEPKPRWAEDWLEWEDFAKFFAQFVRSLTSQSQRQPLGVTLNRRLVDETVIVTADVRTADGGFADSVILDAALVQETGNGPQRRTVAVRHIGPGRFEASIPATQYGRDRQMVWGLRPKRTANRDASPKEKQPDASLDQITVPYSFVDSFSPEYRTLGADRPTLDAVRAREQGSVMSVGKTRWVSPDRTANRRTPLWPYLLAAALLMIPLDILIRRVDFAATRKTWDAAG